MRVQMHMGFTRPPETPDPRFVAHLAERRRQLTQRLAPADQATAWQLRSYPVLAIHAPVMTTLEGKIEYPGDPMCLYSALSLAVDQATQARQAALGEDDPYNDVCPRWGRSPSRAYRFQVNDDGVRDYTLADPNTDQTVYAPGVWNEEIKRYFAEHVLKAMHPRVVLISAVSPAHRYTFDIARTIREHCPEALIVLGGRHADETMRYQDVTGRLHLAPSSAIEIMTEGHVGPVIDFVLSGDGYFALDLLMKAISMTIDMEHKRAPVSEVVRALDALADLRGAPPGQAVIAALAGDVAHVFPLRGRPFDLAELPSPYKAFAIRARFPIFVTKDGAVQRTAHIMTANSCPYHCYYCSESASVTGRSVRFTHDPTRAALDRVFEYVNYGAEAMFFDDSILCGGNTRLMLELCAALAEAKATHPKNRWIEDEEDWQRLDNLQWGAQLTVEYLTSLQSRDNALELLRAMHCAGCTYLYFGIESMSARIMSQIHKNLRHANSPAWADKVYAAMLVAKESRIRVGASVLFGLDGETHATIDETVAGIKRLLASGLLCVASPNILTYHPATAITVRHEVQDDLDYHSLGADVQPPYSYFEEAFPQVISKELGEDDIWYIYKQTRLHWSRELPLDPYAVHPEAIRDVWGLPRALSDDEDVWQPLPDLQPALAAD